MKSITAAEFDAANQRLFEKACEKGLDVISGIAYAELLYRELFGERVTGGGGVKTREARLNGGE